MTVLKTDSDVDRVAPISITSVWTEAIEAGGINNADATPSVFLSVSADRNKEREKNGGGTTLVARILYNDDVSAVTTQPIVGVYGWTVDAAGTMLDQPSLLVSKAGNVFQEITMDATNDADSGTVKATSPNVAKQAWDGLACNRFRFLCQTAAAGTGTFDDAVLQVKFL